MYYLAVTINFWFSQMNSLPIMASGALLQIFQGNRVQLVIHVSRLQLLQ